MEATARTYRYLDADESRGAAQGQGREGQDRGRRNERSVRIAVALVAAGVARSALPAAAATQDELQQWMEQQRARGQAERRSRCRAPKKFDPAAVHRRSAASSRSARRS